MIRDDAGSEELLMGLGTLLASAVLLLVVFSLFRSTLPADRSVALQFAASDVSGDIATVATASVPFSHAEQYSFEGICLTVSSDYVTALDSGGDSFAKPLPVRVNPGNYSGSSVSWNSPSEFRAFINATYGADGSERSPVDVRNASDVIDLLAAARMDMASKPVIVNQSRPLVIEKQLIYVRNSAGESKGCIACVFVYQR